MALDRDTSVIGKKCEVDSCQATCTNGENRCYEHSPNRLIEALFTDAERCRFAGINCSGGATRVNEHDTLMCENCYNVWVRIQRGGMSQSQGPEFLPPNHRWPQRPRYVTGNQQSMGSTYEGRTIGQLAGPHDQLIREATAPPVLPLVLPGSHGSFLRAALGIPPMRRDEGEETE